jgi:hypothetical protein
VNHPILKEGQMWKLKITEVESDQMMKEMNDNLKYMTIQESPETHEEARRFKNEPSAELRNGRKESERRSDTETGMVRRETERRLNDEKQERQLKPFDSTRINRRETKTSKAGRINAIKI